MTLEYIRKVAVIHPYPDFTGVFVSDASHPCRIWLVSMLLSTKQTQKVRLGSWKYDSGKDYLNCKSFYVIERDTKLQTPLE